MSILESEILISCGTQIDYYFENLGYKLPKSKDKQGRLRVPRGSKLLVNIDDLPKGSNAKVTKICDNCGKKIPNQKYVAVINQREKNNGKDICSDCASIKAGITKKNNVKYENSLEFYATNNDKHYLLKEFSYKNFKKPNEISYGDNDLYLWECQKCKGEYHASCNNRINNKSCPFCAGKKILVGFNDLWTTHPHIAALLENPKRGYELSSGVNKKEIFLCEKCGHPQKKIIYSIVDQGFLSCNRCSDGISYPEKFMISILTQIGVEFETQFTFEWAKNKKFDFYIPSLNTIIETHGEQHYENPLMKRNLSEEKENDKIKEQLSRENGIINYIVIDCRKSEKDYIKSNVLSSEMTVLLNLSNVDWNECQNFALNTLVKETCELWSKGLTNVIQIGEILKISRHTVTKYLKKGVELGWCDYNPKDEIKKPGQKYGGSNKKEVVQLSKETNDIILVWESATHAANQLKISRKHISSVCNGQRKFTGGYKWMFKSDYEQFQKTN